jgi:predicted phosphate transport protein (TIGR00153 family)
LRLVATGAFCRYTIGAHDAPEDKMSIIHLKKSKILETQIDEFLDMVSRGSIIFRNGIKEYLDGEIANFENTISEISKLENRADELRRSVENQLYMYSLIPEIRGDVLGLLENLDTVINTEKKTLSQFSVEMPVIPAEYGKDYLALADVCMNAAESLVTAVRAFFHDFNMVKNHLHKVYFYEKEADKISDRLKRRIFNSELDLSRKIHLRYFAMHIEDISDHAEDVADRLSISTIKRNF